MSYFTDPTKIDALALAIVPDPPESASQAQKDAVTEARENLKANFLTEMGAYINTGLNSIFTEGVPAAGDGGAALQIQWKLETT